jgi:hypothetical protein
MYFSALGMPSGGIPEFAMSRLTDIRRLLHEDVPTAKAELRRHVESIELTPQEDSDGAKISKS